MIGKFYRPLKISSAPENRGYHFLHKYKSNFIGIYQFEMEISLKYRPKDETENIHISFQNLEIPVLVRNGIVLDSGEIVSSTNRYGVTCLRHLYRPQNITTKESLKFEMLIKNLESDEGKDILEVEMMPIVWDGEEYLEIAVKSETPVVFHSNTQIIVRE